MSNANETIIDANRKGYIVVDGKVYYKSKELKQFITGSRSKYFCFYIRSSKDGKVRRVKTHRLVAYQKYGNEIFSSNLQVRHLDNDSLNNLNENISIGTAKDNCLDKPKELRKSIAIIASSYIKKHNHNFVISLRKSGKTYKEISELTGIKSKGTISFIINKSIDRVSL